MRSLNRLAIGLVTTVIVVVVGLFVILSSNLGSLIVQKVQTVGSSIVQTSVTLQQADIAISGEGQLKGLTIANPEGYTITQAIDLGTLQLEIDSDTLASPVIRIKSIHIEGPTLNYERHDTDTSNLRQLLDNVLTTVEKAQAKSDKESQSVKLIVDRLSLTGVTLSVSVPGTETPIQRSLPDVTMDAIGNVVEGSSAAEILATVMQPLFARAIEEGNLALEALD